MRIIASGTTILLSVFWISSPVVADEPKRIEGLDEVHQGLAVWLSPELQRIVGVATTTVAAGTSVDDERIQKAIANSAAWIKAVLRSEFVPDDLETKVQVIPAGLDGVDRWIGGSGKSPRMDCTKTAYQKGKYFFTIIQSSTSVAIFVSPTEATDQKRRGSGEVFASTLEDWFKELFKHAEASLYIHPIRITDFGADLPKGDQAWDFRDNRWRPSVIAPAKGWEEKLIPIGWERDFRPLPDQRDRVALAQRIGEIDPTMSEELRMEFVNHWWARTYAATDGRTLFYFVPKTYTGGQSWGVVVVPDWFRKLGVDEVPDNQSSKAGQSRPTSPPFPPKAD